MSLYHSLSLYTYVYIHIYVSHIYIYIYICSPHPCASAAGGRPSRNNGICGIMGKNLTHIFFKHKHNNHILSAENRCQDLDQLLAAHGGKQLVLALLV